MYRLSKINSVHGDFDFSDEVVFAKTIKIKDLQHQSLTSEFAIWYLVTVRRTQALVSSSGIWSKRKRFKGILSDSQALMHPDLKGEGLVEDRTEVFALDFGFELLLFVWQHVNFDVWIRSSSHVHGREILSLEDPDYQLKESSMIRLIPAHLETVCYFFLNTFE